MNDIPLEQRHWSVRWAYTKWPVAVKAASIIVAIAGGVGTIMGLGGSLIKSIANHDESVRLQATVAEQLKQRNDKIDATLKYHGQEIYTTQQSVFAIDKKVDGLGHKLDTVVALEREKK